MTLSHSRGSPKRARGFPWPLVCSVGLLLNSGAAEASGIQGSGHSEMMRRVADLEAELALLKARLEAEHPHREPEPAALSVAPPVAKPDRRASYDGDTTVRVTGFVKLDTIATWFDGGVTATNPLGRDYYLPSAIPVGTGRARLLDAHTKQTRLAITATTRLQDHAATAHVEADFQGAPGTQGSERTTNGYNPALRRAFVSYRGWTFGQDWTTFQYLPALPETADFIGPVEGTVFVRQAQVRRDLTLSENLMLSLAVENAETASVSLTSPVLTENDADQLPDLAARLVYRSSNGEISLAGIARQLTVKGAAGRATGTGWGISLAGKMPLGLKGQHDIRFMLSAGSGVGRYIGLNFAPDVVLVGPSALNEVQVVAGFAAARYQWSSRWRSTVMGSFQHVAYPRDVAPLGSNKTAWSVAANLFYSPVRLLDLGLEVRHAAREVVGGETGNLDRLQFVVKHGF